jgi:hypothetical protein
VLFKIQLSTFAEQNHVKMKSKLTKSLFGLFLLSIFQTNAQSFSVVDTFYLGQTSLLDTAKILSKHQNQNNLVQSVAITEVLALNCASVGTNELDIDVFLSNDTVQTTFSLVVLDTIAPQISLQSNVTLNLNQNGNRILAWANINNGSSDNCDYTVSLNPSIVNCSDIGTKTLLVTLTDASGNSTIDSTQITVVDNINPNIVVGQNTFYLDNSGQVGIDPADLNGGSSDNCDNNFTYTLSQTNFGVSDIGPNIVNFGITNSKGESANLNTTIFIRDTTPPTIVSSIKTATLDASGNVNIVPDLFDDACSDNSLIYTLSLSKTSFNCTNLDTNILILTATDNYNNSRSEEVKLVIKDIVNPVVHAKNIILNLGVNGTAALTPNLIDNGSTDNCNLTLNISDTLFDCTDIGTQNVYLTGTDASGNSASALSQVTVVDNNYPTISSQNITAYLDQTGNVLVDPILADNGSSDACSGTLTFALSDSSFNCANQGINSVIFKIKDNDGNIVTAPIEITVLDTIKPIVTLQNTSLFLDTNGILILKKEMIDNGSSDNCSDHLDFSFSDSVFNINDLGNQYIDITISDNSNNTVIINNHQITIADTTAPLIHSGIDDLLDYSLPNSCGRNILFPSPVVSDNSGSTTISYSQGSGTFFPVGETMVIYTIADAQLNSVVDSFKVVVVDTIAPVLVQGIVNYTQDTNNVVTWDNTQIQITDNCTPDVNYTLSHNSGDTFPVGSSFVSIEATDTNGNTVTFVSEIIVKDLVVPQFTFTPADSLSFFLSQNDCETIVSYDSVVVVDNSPVSISYSIPSGTHLGVGNHPVLVTAEDTFNNKAYYSFTISVVDSIKPTFTHVPSNLVFGECDTVINYPVPEATDNCQIKVITQIAGQPSGSSFAPGIHTLVYKAIDVNDNESIVSFEIEIVETTPPNIDNILIPCGDESLISLTNNHLNTSFKGNGIANGSFDPSLSGIGNHLIHWVYENNFGCTEKDSFWIEVRPEPEQPKIEQVDAYKLQVHNAYDKYQWYRNAVKINGATGVQLEIFDGGNYEVIVSNEAGCSKLSDIYNIGGGKHPSLDIPELKKEQFVVHQNRDLEFIELFSFNPMNQMKIHIYDVLGKLMMPFEVLSSDHYQMKMSTSNVKPGLYYMIIETETQKKSLKIIIQ